MSMKFRCERDTLVEALSAAGRAVTTRGGALPVLAGVRMELVGDRLTVTGSDLDLTITVEVEVLFFSTIESISAERKFAGANGDPTFADVMGLDAGALPGSERPWNTYCGAFV